MLCFFFYFITSKFPSYFSQIIVDLNIQSINSIVLVTRLSSALDHYLFSIFLSHSHSLSAPSAGLYLPSPRILCFWIPQTVTWPIPSKSVTKFGRTKAMMPVHIVFLLIRSYLVNWPFYLSVFCVNEWYGPAPERLILTSIVRLRLLCYILWPYKWLPVLYFFYM